MPLTARLNKQIEKALKKNGFRKIPTHHNRYRYYTLAGIKSPVKTHISHGSKDYGDDLLSKMADQLKLTKKELIRFIDGEMSQQEYEAILKDKGIL
jgi:predicted RNA binding protein YcfA (HicA-like mRNA interferase family)